jgi:hypothetical protein
MQARDQIVTLDDESAYDNLITTKRTKVSLKPLTRTLTATLDSFSPAREILHGLKQAYKPNNPRHFDRNKAKRLCLYLLTNDYCKAIGCIYW